MSKNSKKPLTPEQVAAKIEVVLKDDLARILSGACKPLKYPVKAGDVIGDRTGHRGDMVVVEVYDGGRAFRVKLKNDELQVIKSTDVQYKGLSISEESHSRKYRKSINFGNRDVTSLLHMHYYQGIDYSPDYQRGLVWTIEEKRALIDSIMKDYEIGKFAFIERHPNIGLEIVDGKQRLTTLVEFYEDGFTYMGKIFSELSQADKNAFMGRLAAVGIVQEDQFTREDALEYFLRINTSGVVQSTEHLAMVANLLKKEQRK